MEVCAFVFLISIYQLFVFVVELFRHVFDPKSGIYLGYRVHL